ncbi:hypothetical protein B0H13DRAFT_1910109 [Mycena leptocephala]|nr:hypothetical protein B0H13DRAFT_1910109 [Mycena leptocephala]
MKMNIHPRSTKREGMVGDGIRNQESGIRNQSLEAEAEAEAGGFGDIVKDRDRDGRRCGVWGVGSCACVHAHKKKMNIPAHTRSSDIDVDDGISILIEAGDASGPVLGPCRSSPREGRGVGIGYRDVGRDRFGWDRDMELGLGLGIAIIDRKGVGWEGVDHWQADGLVRDAKEQVGSVYDGKLQTAAALHCKTPPPPPPPPHIPRVPELEFEPANQRPGMQSPRRKRRILPFPSSCIMIPNSNDAPVGYVHYTGMRTERIQDTGFRVGYSDKTKPRKRRGRDIENEYKIAGRETSMIMK